MAVRTYWCSSGLFRFIQPSRIVLGSARSPTQRHSRHADGLLVSSANNASISINRRQSTVTQRYAVIFLIYLQIRYSGLSNNKHSISYRQQKMSKSPVGNWEHRWKVIKSHDFFHKGYFANPPHCAIISEMVITTHRLSRFCIRAYIA